MWPAEIHKMNTDILRQQVGIIVWFLEGVLYLKWSSPLATERGAKTKNGRRFQPHRCPGHRTQAGGTSGATNRIENYNRQEGSCPRQSPYNKGTFPPAASHGKRVRCLLESRIIDAGAGRTCLREEKAF